MFATSLLACRTDLFLIFILSFFMCVVCTTAEKVVAPSPRELKPEPEQQHELSPSSSSASSSSSSSLQAGPTKDHKIAYVRRSVMDEGNIGAAAGGGGGRDSGPESGSGSRHSHGHGAYSSMRGEGSDSEGDSDGLVQVDVNRLSVLERRERNMLRKLLQAKGLMTSEAVVDGVSGNNSGRSSNNHTSSGSGISREQEEEEEGELSASLLLAQRVLHSQQVLALLGEALQRGGRIKPEDAAR